MVVQYRRSFRTGNRRPEFDSRKYGYNNGCISAECIRRRFKRQLHILCIIGIERLRIDIMHFKERAQCYIGTFLFMLNVMRYKKRQL